MADIFDQATAVEEFHRDIALRNRRQGPAIAETGHCLDCDTPTTAGRRWCDADCRDAWERGRRRN